MGTKVTDTGGGDFTPVPAGLHPAVCVAYIDLGTQEMQDFNDPKETTLKQQVVLMWETPEELIEVDGEMKPFAICKFYTKSIGEKANLCKDLESWRGRKFTPEEKEGFDLDNILGVPCQLNVIHEQKKNKVSAKITAVLPLSKGMKKPAPSIQPWRYDIIEDGPIFPESLTDGFKKMIMKSQEFAAFDAVASDAEQEPEYGLNYQDDDIPF